MWEAEKTAVEEYVLRGKTETGSTLAFLVHVRRGKNNRILNIYINGDELEIELPAIVLQILAVLNKKGIIDLNELLEE